MNKDITIGDYVFQNTCGACPEQYDVYSVDDTEKAHLKAYVRLRWGRLYAACPDVGGEVVYTAYFPDACKGSFYGDTERTQHLTAIADQIKGYYNAV